MNPHCDKVVETFLDIRKIVFSVQNRSKFYKDHQNMIFGNIRNITFRWNSMTNKRVIAHFAHLWNTFNQFFFNNTLCKAMIIPYRCLIKNHYVLLMKWMFLICKTTVLFTQGCLWQDLLKIALIWSKRFSNFVKCIFATPPHPRKRAWPIIWTQIGAVDQEKKMEFWKV